MGTSHLTVSGVATTEGDTATEQAPGIGERPGPRIETTGACHLHRPARLHTFVNVTAAAIRG